MRKRGVANMWCCNTYMQTTAALPTYIKAIVEKATLLAQIRLAGDHGGRHEDDEALAEPVLDHQVVELREVGAFGKQEVGGVPI